MRMPKIPDHFSNMKGIIAMNMREVARTLGVTYDQVYRLIWAGRLRGEKVDGKWRIEQASVEAYRGQRRTRTKIEVQGQ